MVWQELDKLVCIDNTNGGFYAAQLITHESKTMEPNNALSPSSSVSNAYLTGTSLI